VRSTKKQAPAGQIILRGLRLRLPPFATHGISIWMLYGLLCTVRLCRTLSDCVGLTSSYPYI
jgi:hypothetical protein